MILQRKTYRVIAILLAMLAVLTMLIVSSLDNATALESPTQTLTPAERVNGVDATQTAQQSTLFARATQILAGVTQTDAIDETSTAVTGKAIEQVLRSRSDATQTAVQLTLFAQATQILADVTRTAAIDQTNTATALGTYGPAKSPTPTLSPTPLAPLAQQAGFSDPELDKLEAARINMLNASLEFTGNGHHYRLLSIWSTVTDFAAPGGTVVLYQTDNGHPKLLWSHDYARLDGKTPSIKNIQAPLPGEWNGDGKVFFAVHGDQDGTIWSHGYYFIYEITPDATVVSRLKGVIPAGFIVIKLEQQEDHTLLLWAFDVRGEMAFRNPNCCGPEVVRYYKWRDDKIINASIEHINEYISAVGNKIYHLTTAKVISDDDAIYFGENLYQLLTYYEAMEQRDAGWTLVQDLVAEAKRSNRLSDGTYIDKVFMPTMARLYKENRAFVPPDVANFSRPEVGYYDNDS